MTFWRAIAAATLLAAAPALLAGEIAPEARRSGYTFMGPDTRAMQDDDTPNPGMLFVLDGEPVVECVAFVFGSGCESLLVEDADGGLGAHDRDLGTRPREDGGSAE